MNKNIIEKYEEIKGKFPELEFYNSMIPENKKFISEGDIIKYINFNDKEYKIKSGFIIRKLDNKLLLKSFYKNNFTWYILLKNNYIFYKSNNSFKQMIIEKVK